MTQPRRHPEGRGSYTTSRDTTGAALFTDLYELTMLQAFFEEGLTEDAVFSLFFRRLPARRNFLLACGLESVLDYLEDISFTESDIAYLESLGQFSETFLSWLRDFRFTGDVYAVPEGTPIFANEPVLEIVAPLPEAQLIETFVMNQIHMQTLLASKAWRIVEAAAGRPVVDFASRRMHGTDAALKGARAFYIAGVAATSNVLAGQRYGIPVVGTMAHSYVQAHEDEGQAFDAFARIYPDTIILVDTYDTIAGVEKVVALSRERGPDFQLKGIRLDSGDLLALSREARRVLDDAGLDSVEIFASSGLDEDAIAALLAQEAPIDGFGVGTSMGVSDDVPVLDVAYKLSEYAGTGRTKLSQSKPILPGRKQIYRISEDVGDVRDVVARAAEDLPGRPLLLEVMQDGRRLPAGRIGTEASRAHAREQVTWLPDRIRAISTADPPYPVGVSEALSRLHEEIKGRVV